MADLVDIMDVAPRDGLQNDPVDLSTDDKLELIARLVDAGLKHIEVTSFVNPKRVPRMADADELSRRLPRIPGVSYVGLLMNERGMERALAAGITEINAVTVASDGFAARNQNMTSEQSVDLAIAILDAARAAGVAASVGIATAFGCPFEGEVPVARVAAIARRLAEAGYREISLADTIGVATPGDVIERFGALAAAAPGVKMRGHFHNTRNTGIANAWAAVSVGVRGLDASLGGIGGCPFAPKATGNIPTDDLAYMLARSGYETGIDLPKLVEASTWLGERLGRQLPAMLGRAGIFPKLAA